jgi:hypothetical protein
MSLPFPAYLNTPFPVAPTSLPFPANLNTQFPVATTSLPFPSVLNTPFPVAPTPLPFPAILAQENLGHPLFPRANPFTYETVLGQLPLTAIPSLL